MSFWKRGTCLNERTVEKLVSWKIEYITNENVLHTYQVSFSVLC
jgi:hypothetical protein